MTKFRDEQDSIGTIQVEAHQYWGAQTQRAIENFKIGSDVMPTEVIYAYAILKKACAHANHKEKKISKEQADAISKACDAILDGKLDDQFPISIFQTGSGTQTNMNVNEVITNYSNEIKNKERGDKTFVHPNDHVNASQSSNDTFPCAMHISAALFIVDKLLPELVETRQCIESKITEFEGIIRVGRTHLQDAVPIQLSQSFSAYRQFILEAIERIHISLDTLYELPIGATAVGTGLNTTPSFAEEALTKICELTSLPFVISANPFASLSGHSAITTISGHIATLAANLNKMVNDIRLLGSGPRCGIGELLLPSNEPGSSIMPGKVNPTQCEAMSMLCLRVMANHQMILNAESSGHLELNTYKPLMIDGLMQSLKLITDGCISIRKNLLTGLMANEEIIEDHLERSLMNITALKPIIGYDNCAKIAQYALAHDTTLKEAALKLELISSDDYDKHVNLDEMV